MSDQLSEPFQAAIKSTFGDLLKPIPEEEYERYNHEVELFWDNYERYLYHVHEYENMKTRTIQFQIEVVNNGNAPAEDIDVWIHFPGGFYMFTEDDFPIAPKEPRPPQKPTSPLDKFGQMGIGGLGNIPKISTQMPVGIHSLINKPVSAFKLKKTNSYQVTDWFEKIKHGDRIKLPLLYIVFDSRESACSFHCEYNLRPANLPEAITGTLNFCIKQ